MNQTDDQRLWVMQQTWSKLLFAHWPIPATVLRPLIPAALNIDTFEGRAWIGVVPFLMSGVRFRGLPPIPTTQQFCELNVRTYVYPTGGKAGVWFFSLDAASWLAVRGARTAFHLPYYDAAMHLQTEGQKVGYRSSRTHRGATPAEFDAQYQPTGSVYQSQPGSLDHWLTERYCLYAVGRQGRIYRGDIVHDPWPLQPARAEVFANSMTQAVGIALPDEAPLLHYAEKINVKAYYLKAV